jgi:hypothetical protein
VPASRKQLWRKTKLWGPLNTSQGDNIKNMAQHVAGVWGEMCIVYICYKAVYNLVRDKRAV